MEKLRRISTHPLYRALYGASYSASVGDAWVFRVHCCGLGLTGVVAAGRVSQAIATLARQLHQDEGMNG